MFRNLTDSSLQKRRARQTKCAQWRAASPDPFFALMLSGSSYQYLPPKIETEIAQDLDQMPQTLDTMRVV